jgi:hypothetical protein
MDPNMLISDSIRRTGGVRYTGVAPQGPGQGMDRSQEALAKLLMQNGSDLKNITDWKQFSALLSVASKQNNDEKLSEEVRSSLFDSFNSVFQNDPAFVANQNMYGKEGMAKDLDGQFEKAFVAFLGTYQPPTSEELTDHLDAFSSQYQDFLGLGKDGVTLEDFETNFNETFGTKEGFQEEVQLFSEQQIEDKGFFIPKQSEEDWSKTMDEITIQVEVPPEIKTDEKKPRFSIMSMVQLLLETTDVLRNLVVVQAKAVEKNIQQQKAKNQWIASVGMVTQSDQYGYLGRKDSKDKKDAADRRSDLNTNTNNTIQGWQQLRDMDQTDAKGLEQFMQTLNQMISQRYDLCNTLVQSQTQITSRLM